MIAIKVAAIGLFMLGAAAWARSWTDQPGSSTAQQEPQADGQEQAPPQAAPEGLADQADATSDQAAADAALADQPDAAGDGATSGADADSVGSDRPVAGEPPAWLVGRWCDSGRRQLFTIPDTHHVRTNGGTLYPLGLIPGREGWMFTVMAVMQAERGFRPDGRVVRGPELGRFGGFNPPEGEGSFRSPVYPFDRFARC